jgi:hypothetical protein
MFIVVVYFVIDSVRKLFDTPSYTCMFMWFPTLCQHRRKCAVASRKNEELCNLFPPSSAEVTEWVELYLHSPNTPSWRGFQEEHRDRGRDQIEEVEMGEAWEIHKAF